MPGFMQSIKSHLPQSPFSPTKKNASVIVPSEVAALPTDATVAEEQLSSEVLPGEALIQHNSSTVALDLTPANGESSKQLPSGEAEVTEDPINQTESPAELKTVVAVNEEAVKATEPESEPIQPEIALPATEEAVAPTPSEQPEVSTIEAPVVEAAPEVKVTPSPEVSNAEAVEAQVENEEGKPDEQVAQETVVAGEELTASTEIPIDASASTPEAEEAKPAAKAGKDTFSTHVKRNKSKKCKSDTPASTEASDVGESSARKPRKSHPLAGKFRSVIEQVRSKSKAKKDRDVTISTPVVAIIEPTPGETSVSA